MTLIYKVTLIRHACLDRPQYKILFALFGLTNTKYDLLRGFSDVMEVIMKNQLT